MDTARENDWDVTRLELLELQAKEKMIFHQKYDKKGENILIFFLFIIHKMNS